jgi:hypothetical protein
MGIHKLMLSFWGVLSSKKLRNIMEDIYFIAALVEITVTHF